MILIGLGVDEASIQEDRNNKQVILKTDVPFTYCITEIK